MFFKCMVYCFEYSLDQLWRFLKAKILSKCVTNLYQSFLLTFSLEKLEELFQVEENPGRFHIFLASIISGRVRELQSLNAFLTKVLSLHWVNLSQKFVTRWVMFYVAGVAPYSTYVANVRVLLFIPCIIFEIFCLGFQTVDSNRPGVYKVGFLWNDDAIVPPTLHCHIA